MSRKIVADWHQLHKIYTEQIVTLRELAEKQGFSYSTLRNNFTRLGLKLKENVVKRKIEFENLDEFYARFLNGESMSSMSLELGMCSSWLSSQFKRKGYDISIKVQRSKLKGKDLDIIELYNSGKTADEIGNMYNVSKDTVLHLLKRNNVQVRTSVESKYHFTNKSFFRTVSEWSAYIYGFILTDGCLSKGAVSIELCKRDKHLLEDILSAINLKTKVRERSRFDKRTLNTYEMCSISFSNKELVSDLISLGLEERKSLKEVAPDVFLNDKHFWRGVVDGDGWVMVGSNGYPRLGLCGGKTICEQFLIYCMSIDTNCISEVKRKGSDFYSVVFNGSKCVKVLQHLYEGSNIKLERKYKVYQEIMNALHKRPI